MPHRGRPTARYPESLGRVPLHRRGTSKTYERLEDLLREAGYKETRVFTPETDRNARPAVEKDGVVGNTMRGSVGAVVDFITGLVSRGPSLSRDVTPLEDDSAQHPWSPPPSPLAHAIHIKNSRAKRVPSRGSLSRKGSPENIRRRTYPDLPIEASEHTHAYQVVQPHQSSRELPHHPRSYPRPHHHLSNNRHQQQLNHYSSKSASTKPNPPNARAYLRHMVSAPNIHPLTKRPSLSEASLRSHALTRERQNSTRPTFILNDEDSIAESDCEPHPRITRGDNEHQVHPPLPRNWIESVAKALLSGVGGPAAVTSDAASTRTVMTVSTRKSSALSDKSNQAERGRAPTRGTKPPLLCVQVQEVKARTSEGQVSCTRVMCRSTPTSRASSRVRNSGYDDHTTRSGGKRRETDKSRNRGRGKDRDVDVVPSLARTRVENDDWMAPRRRYANGWGMEGSAQAYPDGTWSDDSDHNDDDDDDDDEGELGLDRLLVPARRQHSIQSLRKHLRRHRLPSQGFNSRGAPGAGSPRSSRSSPFGVTSSGRPEWGNASWGTSRGREWLANQGEEGEDGYVVGTGRSSTKWRRGLPGLAQWTTSS